MTSQNRINLQNVRETERSFFIPKGALTHHRAPTVYSGDMPSAPCALRGGFGFCGSRAVATAKWKGR